MKGKTDNRLGDVIYKAREAKGISTVKLGSLVGAHQSTLARIQLGQNTQPAPQLLSKIAKALDLKPSDLHALAGYTPASELPELSGWLKVKHRGLPESAAVELQGHLDYLLSKQDEEKKNEGREHEHP